MSSLILVAANPNVAPYGGIGHVVMVIAHSACFRFSDGMRRAVNRGRKMAGYLIGLKGIW